MIKIFHNPRCKHSRAGLGYLRARLSDFQVREYLKNPITKEEIKEILLKSNLHPTEIVRTQDDYYKRNLKGKNFNDDEWIKILVDNPKLIQRPIVVGKYKAVLANPPEEIDKMLNK